jgi:hypothetical protein
MSMPKTFGLAGFARAQSAGFASVRDGDER